MKNIPIDVANQLILKKQHLTENTKIDDILQISDDLCGLHATGTIEPYLTLFSRTNSFKKEDLDEQLYIKKNLGRIRGMRKTLFIETKYMIPIVHNSIKSQTEKRDEQYLEIREISVDEFKSLSNKILDLLSEKELSTTEIKKVLMSKKDIVAVISIMCDKMLLIRGKPIKSWKDRRIYYAPFSSYFPDIDINKYSQEEAIQLLIQKYIKSYGPVTLNDITWWLGFTKTHAKKILKALNEQIEIIKIADLDLEYIIYKDDLNELNRELSEHFGVKEGRGLMVSKFGEDSPAEKAGLKVGDVIVTAEGVRVERVSDLVSDLSELIQDKEKGDKIKIEFLRDKKKRSVEIEIEEEEGGRAFFFSDDWESYVDSWDKHRESLKEQYEKWQDRYSKDYEIQMKRLNKELEKIAKKSKEATEKLKLSLKKKRAVKV